MELNMYSIVKTAIVRGMDSVFVGVEADVSEGLPVFLSWRHRSGIFSSVPQSPAGCYGSKLATYAARCIENELLMYFRSKKKVSREISLYEPIGTDKEGNHSKRR